MESFFQEKICSNYTKFGVTDSSLRYSNLEYLNLHRGEQVLELGCGTGRETMRAAILVGKYGQAVGLDLAPEMLITARQTAREKGIENIVFLRSSIENLPFDNNIFDAVFSDCVLNYTLEKEIVYAEIFRVLASGGRFVVSEAVGKKPLPDHNKNGLEQRTVCSCGAVTEEDYLYCIRSAGFRDIHILNKRTYLEKGYDFTSLTIKAVKKKTRSKIMAGPQCEQYY